MNIVIPLSPFNNTDNAELKYALRGFEKYLPHTGITIIGRELPDWSQGLSLIKFADVPDERFRDRNIMRKLLAYADAHRLDDFIYANDDHFLLQQFNGHQIVRKGTLGEAVIGLKNTEPYKHTIENTMKYFGVNKGPLVGGKDYYNYDVHYPCIMNWGHYTETVIYADWTKPFGFMLKSIYYRVAWKSVLVEDFKINEPSTFEKIKESLIGKSFFSTSDKAFNAEMQKVLEYLYPVKSKYER